MKRNFRWVRCGAHALTFALAALLSAGLAFGQNEASSQQDEPAPSPTEDAPPDASDDQDRPAADERERNQRREQPSDDPSAERPAAEREQESSEQRREAERPDLQRDPQSLDRPRPSGQERELDPRDSRGQARRERQDESRRPRGLGMTLEEDGQEGLTVTDVQPESAAAQAGLRPNDRILSVDGRQVANPRRLRAYLGGQFGRQVPLVIERNGRQYTVQFEAGGGGENAWLGVYMTEDEEEGARVSHIYPTSPAARAGFRPGDVILEVNGEQVQSAPDVIALVEDAEPGSQAEFVVRRGDEEVDLTAKLGRRDSYVFFRNDRSRAAEGRDEEDPFGNVPPYMMQLEHDRRMAEQHQRMEEAINQLREEVRQLREEIMKR